MLDFIVAAQRTSDLDSQGLEVDHSAPIPSSTSSGKVDKMTI